jgi:hypothetical protein
MLVNNRNNINNNYFIKDNQQGSLKISVKFNYSYLYTTSAVALAKANLEENFLNKEKIRENSKSINSDIAPNKSFDLSRDVHSPNYLYFLGGFVEGEGSNSVAVSVGKEFKYGVNLQPIFNVSQHVNGINILYSFKELFEAGSVVKKSGSEDV